MSFLCHLSKLVNILLINRDWLLISQVVLCQSLLHISPNITAALMGEPSLHSRFLDPSFTVLCCSQADLSRCFEPRSVVCLGPLHHLYWSLRLSTAERWGWSWFPTQHVIRLDGCPLEPSWSWWPINWLGISAIMASDCHAQGTGECNHRCGNLFAQSA